MVAQAVSQLRVSPRRSKGMRGIQASIDNSRLLVSGAEDCGWTRSIRCSRGSVYGRRTTGVNLGQTQQRYWSSTDETPPSRGVRRLGDTKLPRKVEKAAIEFPGVRVSQIWGWHDTSFVSALGLTLREPRLVNL